MKKSKESKRHTRNWGLVVVEHESLYTPWKDLSTKSSVLSPRLSMLEYLFLIMNSFQTNIHAHIEQVINK